jgi:hypothetical protein
MKETSIHSQMLRCYRGYKQQLSLSPQDWWVMKEEMLLIAGAEVTPTEARNGASLPNRSRR